MKRLISIFLMILSGYCISSCTITKSSEQSDERKSTVNISESQANKSQEVVKNNNSSDRIISEGSHFKTVQNTDYNWVDIYFYSDNPSPCVIKLYTIGGDEVLSKTTKVKQGKNSARLTTTDLPSGMYMLVVDMDGHILSGSISINR